MNEATCNLFLGLLPASLPSCSSLKDCSLTDSNGVTGSLDAWWKCQNPWQVEDREGSSWCIITDNDDGTFPTNANCNNAGTCVTHEASQTSFGFTWGKCQCADTSKVGNFVYNSSIWSFQAFDGDECTEFNFQLYGTITYMVKVEAWSPSSGTRQGISGQFECNVGSGSGIDWNPNDGSGTYLTIPDMTPMVQAVIMYNEYWDAPTEKLRQNGYFNYKGTVWPIRRSSVQLQHCKICKDTNQCELEAGSNYGDIRDDGNNVVGGYLMVSFGTNYNTYYNRTCEKPNKSFPEDQDGAEKAPNCDANFDGGKTGRKAWEVATLGTDTSHHHKEHFKELTEQSTSFKVFDCADAPQMSTDCIDNLQVFGMSWGNSIWIFDTYNTYGTAEALSTTALIQPTKSPTVPPTKSPTSPPTTGMEDCFDKGYTHTPEDLKFLGIAESGTRGCRWGIETSWPQAGGPTPEMCGSPYVTCLPQENTPCLDNTDIKCGYPTWPSGQDPYPADDADYTIAMCKKACAFTQRCNGFEFIPTGETNGDMVGSCKLIDDIPIVATSSVGSSANGGITTESQLESTAWDAVGGAVCYMKDVDCHPYFGANDLEDVMMTCYCPNNRKGFYTKNVVRTPDASRFCPDPPSGGPTTQRIKNAQANRMFHLCENWCLFNTQDPRMESWYHDPWEECWREQYAGVGTHRSYCYRVIRDPFTIEQYFMDQRSANMCPSSTPAFGDDPNTPSPVMGPVTTTKWVLADAEDSCDDACSDEGLTCNQEDIEAVINGVSNPQQYWDQVEGGGYDCQGNFVDSDTTSPNGSHGWALPAVGPDGQCMLRHPDANNEGTNDGDLYVGCNVAVGVGYQRLCACGN